MYKWMILIFACNSFAVSALEKTESVQVKNAVVTPEVHLKSTFYGDNRERIPVDKPYAPSYTLLGVVNQLYLSAGEKPIQFHLGVSHRLHLGGEVDEEKPNILAWFHASFRQVNLRLGIMPFDLIQSISPALLEEAHFRYPVLEGMFLTFQNNRFDLKLWIDWVGSQTEQRREAFLLGLSLKSQLIFGLEASLDGTLFHHAGLKDGPDVLEESGGIIAKLNYRLDTIHFNMPTKYELSAGYYLAFARDRNQSNDWETSPNFLGQFKVSTKYVGLDSEISVGKSTGIEVDFRRPAYQSQKYLRVSPVLFVPQANLRFMWDLEVIDNKLTQMQRIWLKYQYRLR